MKVLVVNNMAPFVWGGAEELALHLQKNLIAAGHQSEVLRLPFQWAPATRIPSQMLMVRAFEIWNVDRVIALKFPAYLVRHPHKTLWLLHQYRQAYDLYDAGQSNLPPGQEGEDIRSLIRNADNEAVSESRQVFTLSENTRKRLNHYNGLDAQVLPQPLNDPEIFCGGKAEGYIFAGGRINSMKRQHLLLEALAQTPANIRLVIAGPADSPADVERLERLAETFGLNDDRLRIDARFLPRAEIAALVNGASACACLPYDEDCLSYVAMEAACAGKPIISTTDSGGVLGLARHQETGWVVAPQPQTLAEAMTQVIAQPARARDLGASAKTLWNSLGITWPRTIESLLQ